MPTRRGDGQMRRLIEAGQELGVTPYGTEALGVLRIEQGHLASTGPNGQFTAPLRPGNDLAVPVTPAVGAAVLRTGRKDLGVRSAALFRRHGPLDAGRGSRRVIGPVGGPVVGRDRSRRVSGFAPRLPARLPHHIRVAAAAALAPGDRP